jgi:glycosyltransferase involved in cell wall biosynthesis
MSLRVTFLMNRLNFNTGEGSHRSFHLTTTGLSRLGCDVSVVVLDEARSSGLADAPYPVCVEDGWHRATRFERLRAVADIMKRYERDTDVFHVYSADLIPAAGRYRSRGHVPTVATLNGYSLWCTNSDRIDGWCQRSCGVVQRLRHAQTTPTRKLLSLPVRALEQYVAFPWTRHVDHFLPDSPTTKRIYEEAGFDLARSTVVPGLIDFSAIRRAAEHARDRRATRAGPRRLLDVGRLTAADGADVLIDAVPQAITPVHLHVAGDGPERHLLEDRARQLGIAERVTFHGRVPQRQVWGLLQQVDAFVHPGRGPEPFGRTVLEAMAIGVPTIVSYTGGPPWLVGPYGRMFTPGDPSDLAVEIDRLFCQYERALVAAERGIQRAAEFDYQAWAPKIADIYRAVSQPDTAASGRPAAVARAGSVRW